jgi:hypothetical protein
MTTAELTKEIANVARVHEIALQIRKLLDEAAKIELRDGQDGETVVRELIEE